MPMRYCGPFWLMCAFMSGLARSFVIGRLSALTRRRFGHVCVLPTNPARKHSTEASSGFLTNLLAGNSLLRAQVAASDWLRSLNVEDPEDSARYLLSHCTNIGYKLSDFHRHADRVVTESEANHFRSMLQLRAERMPVQYIIGNWDFYGMTLSCRPPILIPRPETEELVENILTAAQLQNLERPRILDVGAGTGAIGLALMSQLSTASCTAIDLNPDAVTLANENAQTVLKNANPTRYQCLHADLRTFASYFNAKASGPAPSSGTFHQPFDLIVSNPPYIPRADLSTLQPEIINYEDARALDGGIDGLDIVRDLIYLAPTMLGSSISGRQGKELWLEVSEKHPALIEQWVASTYRSDRDTFLDAWEKQHGVEMDRTDVSCVTGMTDLSGNPRFVRLKF